MQITHIDKNLKKQDLVNEGVISWTTMAKIEKNENISMGLIDRLCDRLDCQPGDLIEHVKTNKCGQAERPVQN